jgi:hypothetical protein
MGSFEQTKEAIQKAQAGLEAETQEVVRVSQHVNDNLVQAHRGIWRQLFFIWVVVIVLGISYLAVFGYTPLATLLAPPGNSVPLTSRVPGAATESPPAPPSLSPAIPASGNLLKLLNQMREAQYKKDIQLFLEAYSPTFPGLEQKREQTLKIWEHFDYLDLQPHLTDVQQLDATTISGVVTWHIKTRDRQDNEIKTLSKMYLVKFSKESGEWRIQDIEAMATQGAGAAKPR